MISTSYTTPEGIGALDDKSDGPNGSVRFTDPMDDGPIPLPPGLTSRPLVLTDADAVFEVMAAQQLHDTGIIGIEEEDILGDWQRPSFAITPNTLGVFAGETLVAYGEFSGGDRGDAAVHPDHRGQGLGTSLALWMQDQARAAGADRVGMPVPEGSPGDRLLQALGYDIRWTSWELALPEGRQIEDQPLPDGHAIRSATEDDHRDVWTVIEDAFLEWSDRDRQPFEDFAAQVMRRRGFQPWNLRVVTDPTDRIVGAAFVVRAGEVGFVDKVAVAKAHRGRGLARALLADAFAQARAHGATASMLSTDSRSGALGLYERVGMQVVAVWLHRSILL
jgi:mycothiol synthase